MLLRKNISSFSDRELLEHYRKSGKSDYFGELYNRYIPLIYGLCLKYLGQPEKAQDAVMQLFEELMPKVGRYEIEEFRTWVHSVARNHCLQLLRREQREIPLDFISSFMELQEIVHLLDGEEEDEEKLTALRLCVEKLHEKQRRAIEYFFIKEMSYADIADATGYEPVRVKSYIQNGKRNLSICIKKELK
ncbi:MAG: sigma-70 family RNA polymerase sigma factor [Bacteroides sp.]|nr:sigma-70 family RNA polymerase sigma factor [Bacteroides sp.]